MALIATPFCLQMSLQEVQNETLQALSLIRDEVASLFRRHVPEPTDLTQTLWMLFKYQSERSIAVSFLLSHGYPWDAEIILRSFYETTAKILLICFSSAEEQKILLAEFWEQLTHISHRKGSRKADFSRQFARKRGDAFDEAVFAVFLNEKLFPKGPLSKEERRRLEHKWSFSEIIEALSKMELRDIPLTDVRTIFHMYGVASHLAHADSTALDLMIDRQLRDEGERKLLEGAHASRIMTDQVSLGFFSAEALRTTFQGVFDNRDALLSSMNSIFKKSDEVQKRFESSQTEFYKSYGADL